MDNNINNQNNNTLPVRAIPIEEELRNEKRALAFVNIGATIFLVIAIAIIPAVKYICSYFNMDALRPTLYAYALAPMSFVISVIFLGFGIAKNNKSIYIKILILIEIIIAAAVITYIGVKTFIFLKGCNDSLKSCSGG